MAIRLIKDHDFEAEVVMETEMLLLGEAKDQALHHECHGKDI